MRRELTGHSAGVNGVFMTRLKTKKKLQNTSYTGTLAMLINEHSSK